MLLTWSCWCLRGCRGRRTTVYDPGGITAPPPRSASASTSKTKSSDNTTGGTDELLDYEKKEKDLYFVSRLLKKLTSRTICRGEIINWLINILMKTKKDMFGASLSWLPIYKVYCHAFGLLYLYCCLYSSSVFAPAGSPSQFVPTNKGPSNCCKTTFVLLYIHDNHNILFKLFIYK